MANESRSPQLPQFAPRPTILIADGDADTRALYRAIFPPLAYDMHECGDGAEALGRAIAGRPDLLIMETRLSRIDGYALCRLLRSDPLTRSLPIVVVTGAASPGDTARALQAGATRVLVKPCDPEAVVDAAKQALEGSAAVRALHAGGLYERTAQPPSAEPPKPRRKSRGFQRQVTTVPPAAPPPLRCPRCDVGLSYQHSHIGGVNEQSSEQWDYFHCRQCGSYQYRHRTRKLRALP